MNHRLRKILESLSDLILIIGIFGSAGLGFSKELWIFWHINCVHNTFNHSTNKEETKAS